MKKYIILIFVLILVGGSVTGIITMNRKKAQREAQEIYSRATEALVEKKYEEASADLKDALNKAQTPDLKDEIRYELVKILYQQQQFDAIAPHAEKLKKDSDAYWKTQNLLAKIALKNDDLDSAKDIFEQVALFPATKNDGRYGMGLIHYLENEPDKAKRIFDQLLMDAPNAPFITDMKFKLGEVNTINFLSGKPEEDFQIYKVKRGDILFKISTKFRVTVELIMKLNRLRTATLNPNKRLLMPKKEFSLVVDKSTNLMEVFLGGEFFKIYRVRTGRDNWLTPVGDFTILTRVKNPEWTDPKSKKRYAPGDPENELGTRWMAFMGGSIGIHGTIHPESIGGNTSNGCVGMLMPEVEELFAFVPVGTALTIVASNEKTKKYEEVQ